MSPGHGEEGALTRGPMSIPKLAVCVCVMAQICFAYFHHPKSGRPILDAWNPRLPLSPSESHVDMPYQDSPSLSLFP